MTEEPKMVTIQILAEAWDGLRDAPGRGWEAASLAKAILYPLLAVIYLAVVLQ